jgi:hypothetical protein
LLKYIIIKLLGLGECLASYWKLIDMRDAEVISIGKNEKVLIELKMMYENKLNVSTKLIKCFGEDKFKKDWKYLTNKCQNVLDECKHNC